MPVRFVLRTYFCHYTVPNFTADYILELLMIFVVLWTPLQTHSTKLLRNERTGRFAVGDCENGIFDLAISAFYGANSSAQIYNQRS